MHDRFYSRRRTMSLPSPRMTAAQPATHLLLRLTAFAILAARICHRFSRAQDVPAAPAPQTAPVPAQPQAVHLQDYSKPRPAFPHFLQPYRPQEVAQPNLGNSPRIDSLMHDGKIYLSIDDAVALALENNLDIDIARYNLNIADTDYLRAKSGANILGVNTGIVQNTPGGGVGGLGGTVGSGTGGTTVAAGGAGHRHQRLGQFHARHRLDHHQLRSGPDRHAATRQERHGIRQQSSAPCPSWRRTPTRPTSPTRRDFQWGTAVYRRIQQYPRHHQQPHEPADPADSSSNFQFKVTQNLLQGFGSLPNLRFIRIAKNNREISDVAFRLQIITTVDQIENIYWDLVYAYENVRVQQEALTYAQKALDDSKQQAQGRHRTAYSGGERAEHGRHRTSRT